MRDHQRGAGEAGEPALQPHRRFQVEVVRRLVQQQQVGIGEQRRRQCHAHPPAAGEFLHRPRLRRLIEAETGQDGGGAGRGGVGADGQQTIMQLGQAVRVRGFRLRQQRQPFRVALQHDIDQGLRTLRRLLPHRRQLRAGGEADVAAVHRQFAGDGAQQGGLAGAVAADQADAAAGVDGQVRLVQQRAAAHADDGAGNHQ